jgi:hypothetical protein
MSFSMVFISRSMRLKPVPSGATARTQKGAAILLWRELPRQQPPQPEAAKTDHRGQHKNGHAVAQQPCQCSVVGVAQTVDHPHKSPRQRRGLHRAQNLRSHHRCEGEGHEARKAHRRAQLGAELDKELPGTALQERQRCKDRHQNQRGGDHRKTDLAGAGA